MKNSKEYKKILTDIYESQELDRLQEFENVAEWKRLNEEEKELLALLFVMQGDKELSTGDSRALESFRMANAVCPNSPRILCRQALAFTNQTQNLFCLKTAATLYASAVDLAPDNFDAWHGWANSLVRIGIVNQELEPLNDALLKYKKAESLSQYAGTQKLANFYRDEAICWYSLGKLSGEPYDFKQAISFYQKCFRLGLNSPQFWNEYGNALFELAQLSNKTKLIIEAIEMYWKAIKLSPDYLDGWYQLASTLKVLYEMHPQEAYYAFAAESFEQVAKLDPQNSAMWIKWGEMQAVRSRLQHDVEGLKASIKKMEVADVCEPNHPAILSAWGEALLLLGSWTEDLAAIQQALLKFHQSLELDKDHSRTWFLYGSALSELGKYYFDAKYFNQAIDSFRKGLEYDPSDPFLWYGMGLACSSLGQINDEAPLCLEALQHFNKAHKIGGVSTPQFWNDWGITLMNLAIWLPEKRYLEAAVQKLEQALRLNQKSKIKNSNEIDWMYNLGCAYETLAGFDGEVAIFEKAKEIFEKILEADPSFQSVYFNLGFVCSRLCELTGDLDPAFEANHHFELAVGADPEDEQAWNEWGISLVNIAELIHDPLRPDQTEKFFADAESKFLFAAGLGNLQATYHLACLYSLEGQHDAALFYLEKCRENDALPPVSDLLADEWLEGLREHPPFLNFISKIEKADPVD